MKITGYKPPEMEQPEQLDNLRFIDAQHGWAWGGGRKDEYTEQPGTFLITTDGGQHWNETPFPFEQAVAWIFFLNPRTAWASTDNGGFYKTSDGGLNWEKATRPAGDLVYRSIFFADDNNGWAVGLTTLMYERLALGFGLQVRLRIALDGLVDLARRSTKNGVPATRDPLMRQKLAQMWIDTEVFKYTGARAITKLLKGELPGPEASSGKMMWVEGHQRVQEMAMELQGPYAQLMSGSRWAVENGLWQYGFLRSRANSIEGGTTEIQKNIIGERVLGLPKG